MNKEKLIEIYQDTKNVCSTIDAPVSEKLSSPILAKPISKSGKIIVQPMDTITALQKYSTSGKTAVLNMASSKRKGGGVESGSIAQEECLFRCSNLFQIPDEFYPIKTNELIYTKGASFIKDFNYNPIEPIVADVITIAAINLNKNHIDNTGESNIPDEWYESRMLDKIANMINIAAINQCDNIILGAWGCGVFKNDPKEVANLFNTVLESYRTLFETIVFAVINDKNSVANNYQIFLETIKTFSEPTSIGHSIDGDDMHWTVPCPQCNKEHEYTGYFDSEDICSCKCGCNFKTSKVWLDDNHYI